MCSLKNTEEAMSNVGCWAAWEGLASEGLFKSQVCQWIVCVSSWPFWDSIPCSAKWDESGMPCGIVVKIKGADSCECTQHGAQVRTHEWNSVLLSMIQRISPY